MKRKSALLLFVLPLLISGCQSGSSSLSSSATSSSSTPSSSLPDSSIVPSSPLDSSLSSSSSASSSSASSSLSSSSASSSSSSVEEKTFQEKVEEQLLALSTAKSYLFQTTYEGKAVEDVYDFEDGYIYFASTDEGYIDLPLPSGGEGTYSFGKEDGEIVLGGRQSTIASVDELNYASLLNTLYQSDTTKVIDDERIEVNSTDFTLFVAAIFGYASLAQEYYFYNTVLTLDEEDNLTFTLVVDSDFASSGLIPEENLTGSILDIDEAGDTAIESYIENYKAPDITLPKAIWDALKADKLTFTTTLEEIHTQTEIATLTQSYDNENYVFLLDQGGSTTMVSYIKGEDGKAIAQSLDATTGTLLGEEQNFAFDAIAPDFNSYPETDFYAYENSDAYVYYGDDVDDLLNSLVGMDMSSVLGLPTQEVIIHATEEGLTSIEALSVLGYESYTGSPVQYHYEIVVSIPETVVGVAPSRQEDADTFQQTYLDGKLDKTAPVRMVIAENTAYPMYTTTITYDGNIYLESIADNSTNPIQVTYSGLYQIDENHLQRFTVEESEGGAYIATPVGTAYEGKIEDEITLFGISPLVLKKTSDTTYRLIDGAVNAAEGLPSGTRTSSNLAIDGSIEITVSDSYIESITYDCNDFLGTSEKIEYIYENVAVDANIVNALENLAPETESNWSISSKDGIYPDLVEYLGEELAKALPYLYDAAIDEAWSDGGFGFGGIINIYSFSFDIDDATWLSYTEEYGKLLLENVFSLYDAYEGDCMNPTAIYVDPTNTYTIAFGPTMMDGIYIELLA